MWGGSCSDPPIFLLVIIPRRLAANCQTSPERAAWLARLPTTLRDLARRWAITIGPPFDNEDVSCAWVAPVTVTGGATAILKVGMPHMEGEHEIDGLRFWNGDPTVRLLEADEDLNAMLLERCEPGTPLGSFPEADQDLVIAPLLQRLWRAPAKPHRFRPLSDMTALWSAETLSQEKQWSDPALVREGLRLFSELSRTTPQDVLLGTDVHAGNVLEAQRQPWLVIDPKPFIGDRAYDATQHLYNSPVRMGSNPDETIRRFAGLLDVDHQRVRLWMFARAAAEPRDRWNDDWLSALAKRLAP